MPFVPALWATWAVLLLSTIVLKMYVARLGRDEDDELLLQNSSERFRAEQAAILSRLHKMEPVQRVFLWALAAVSMVVVVYYVHDMLNQLFR
jgi:hypothetical protein